MNGAGAGVHGQSYHIMPIKDGQGFGSAGPDKNKEDVSTLQGFPCAFSLQWRK